MNRKLLSLLVAAPISLTALLAPAAAPTPTKADIARLVAEAAAYRPGQSREAFRRLEDLLRDPSSGAQKQLEAALVQLLGPASSYEAREFACRELGIIGSKNALPALAKLLGNDETAGIACLALTTYPRGRADDTLRTALPSSQGMARIQIITTLGDRRDPKSVKVLTPMTTNSDLAVAKAAIAALGKIGDEAARKALVAASKNSDAALQPAYTEALLRCAEVRVSAHDLKGATALYEGVLGGSQPTYVRRAAFDALLQADKVKAQSRILEVLHGSDEALKAVAIANIRDLPPGNASEIFAAELPQLSPQAQVWMIDSLAVRADAASAAAIGNSLASADPAVRRAAIAALGRMGGAWCIPLFARALDRSKDGDERRALESALIDLPGGRQTDLAIAAGLKKTAGNTRAALITALARREGPAANLVLLFEARQDDVPAAVAALNALAKTSTEREVTPLLERLTGTRNPNVRAAAENAVAQALPKIERTSRRSNLIRDALGWAQGPESRIALLGLLPACGDEPALIALKAAAENSDSAIRNAAVRALADWPNASAWDALARIYQQPASETIRATALRGLVRLISEENARPNAKLVERYRLLLNGAHSDADVRLILGALGGAVQPDALQLALPLLARPDVHAEAEVAVKKIAEAIKAQHPQAAAEALKQVQAKP